MVSFLKRIYLFQNTFNLLKMPTTTDIIMGAIRSIRSEFNPKIKELEEKIQKQNEIIEELKKQVELLNRSYKLPI